MNDSVKSKRLCLFQMDPSPHPWLSTKNNSHFIVLNVSPNLLFKIALWFQNVQIFHFSGQTSSRPHPRERGKKGAGMKVGLGVGPTDPTGQFAAPVPALLSVGERWSAEATQRPSTQAPFPRRRQCSRVSLTRPHPNSSANFRASARAEGLPGTHNLENVCIVLANALLLFNKTRSPPPSPPFSKTSQRTKTASYQNSQVPTVSSFFKNSF